MKTMPLLLRQYVATLPGAVAASILVLGTSMLLVGIDNNPIFRTFLWDGFPTLLTVGPLVLITVLKTGLINRSAWLLVIVGIGAIVVTVINVVSLWLDPDLHKNWQEVYGKGPAGIGLGMMLQTVIAVLPAFSYAILFPWITHRWNLR